MERLRNSDFKKPACLEGQSIHDVINFNIASTHACDPSKRSGLPPPAQKPLVWPAPGDKQKVQPMECRINSTQKYARILDLSNTFFNFSSSSQDCRLARAFQEGHKQRLGLIMSLLRLRFTLVACFSASALLAGCLGTLSWSRMAST